MHRAVANVGDDIEGLRFNRAVAQIYELTNGLTQFCRPGPGGPRRRASAPCAEGVERLVQLIAPMMPHLAETCWEALGKTGWSPMRRGRRSIRRCWSTPPSTSPVQVNGKRRGEITVAKGAASATMVETQVLSLDAIARMLEGKAPKKIVIVPDRIVNVVI